jgi:hypothetical protein
VVEHRSDKAQVDGSNPSLPTLSAKADGEPPGFHPGVSGFNSHRRHSGYWCNGNIGDCLSFAESSILSYPATLFRDNLE